jgi:hypothetical protein
MASDIPLFHTRYLLPLGHPIKWHVITWHQTMWHGQPPEMPAFKNSFDHFE